MGDHRGIIGAERGLGEQELEAGSVAHSCWKRSRRRVLQLTPPLTAIKRRGRSPARLQRFGDQHVDHRFLKGGAEIGHGSTPVSFGSR